MADHEMTTPSISVRRDVNLVDASAENRVHDADRRTAAQVDRHVGTRIRLQRVCLGMSQSELANNLGLTFQQVQKYERGVNRVGASRLFQLSRALDVPIAFFFEGVRETKTSHSRDRTGIPVGHEDVQTHSSGVDEALVKRRETRNVLHAYYGIAKSGTRKRMLNLMRSMAAAHE